MGFFERGGILDITINNIDGFLQSIALIIKANIGISIIVFILLTVLAQNIDSIGSGLRSLLMKFQKLGWKGYAIVIFILMIINAAFNSSNVNETRTIRNTNTPKNTNNTSENIDILKNKKAESVINYIEQGRLLYKSGKYEEAIAAFREGIKLNPKDIDAYRDLGITHIKVGQTEEAIKVFEKGISIDSTTTTSYFMKWAILNIKGYNKDALLEINVAIMKDPTNAVLYMSKGISLKNLKRYNEAILSFDDALKFDPNNSEIIAMQKGVIVLMTNGW